MSNSKIELIIGAILIAVLIIPYIVNCCNMYKQHVRSVMDKDIANIEITTSDQFQMMFNQCKFIRFTGFKSDEHAIFDIPSVIVDYKTNSYITPDGCIVIFGCGIIIKNWFHLIMVINFINMKAKYHWKE